MRSISISTDVFAKIWSLREDGESSEDEILARELGCKPSRSGQARPASDGGYHSRRFNVNFVEGFEIFRNFKGRDYRARATGGRWLLIQDGKYYDALSALSSAVGAKIENAWANWLYTDDKGQRRPISDLRDPTSISKRRQ